MDEVERRVGHPLSGAIELAVKEWGERQTAMVRQDNLRAEARRAAAVFDRELVAFRRALRHAIGTSHRDYQALRYPRSGPTVVDDDAPLIEEETNETAEGKSNGKAAVPTTSEVGMRAAVNAK